MCDFEPESLINKLTLSERERAQHFLNTNDRNLYSVSRTLLKKILSFYSDVDSNDIQINYNPFGKPYFENYPDIHFSVSHTNDLVLIGAAENAEIGVDIEHLEREVDYTNVSNLVFTNDEFELFKSSESNSKKENFINCWTRKEAFFKAKGLGLTFPFNQLEVSFLKNKKTEIIATKWRKEEKDEWFMQSFDLPGNYRGALVVNGDVNAFDLIQIKSITHDFEF